MASRTGQSAVLEFGQPRMISGGRIELDLILNTGGQSISAFTSDIRYDLGTFSAIEALTGAAATAAGKIASLGTQSGHARVLIYGLNTNAIGDGVVATLRLTPQVDLNLVGTLLR